MNLAACKQLALQPINAIWYRAISAEHWETVLRTDQTMQSPTRFNPGSAARAPFEMLYLAENPLAAYYGSAHCSGRPNSPWHIPPRGKSYRST